MWTQVAAGMAEGLRNLLAVLIQAAVLAHGAAVAQANASATWGLVKEGHPEYVSIYVRLPYMSEYMSGEKSEDMSKYLSEYIYNIII